jgi:hypothetical protein
MPFNNLAPRISGKPMAGQVRATFTRHAGDPVYSLKPLDGFPTSPQNDDRMNRNRKSSSPHWKAMGLLVLFGMVLIVSFSCFPIATRTLLAVGMGIALLFSTVLPILLRRHNTHPAPLVSAVHTNAQPNPPQIKSPAKSTKNRIALKRFWLHVALLGSALLCGLTYDFLRRHGWLTPKSEPALPALIFLAGVIYSSLNLKWGLRENRIWLGGFGTIERASSPANFWVAVAGYVYFTVAFAAGFVYELLQLLTH